MKPAERTPAAITTGEQVAVDAVTDQTVSTPAVARPTGSTPAVAPSDVSPPSLLAGLLAAFGLTGSPALPSESPTLWAVLAWTRRQFVGAFYNRAPIAQPSQIAVDGNGLIRGTLGAVDPDGDPLRFTVDQQPVNGTVTVNSDGSYTYVPDDPTSTATDTFTVTVRDIGFRLFSQPGVTTTTVSVRVGAPLVTTAPGVGTPDAATGQVSGSLGVTDPNSPAGNFTYTVVDKPLYGSVTFNAAGGYVYTPSAIGRIQAAANPGVTDSFSVAVGTAFSPATTVTVDSVPVAAGTISSTENAIGTSSFPFGVAVSKDGSRAYVTNTDRGTISVVDLHTGQVSAPITVGGTAQALAISADGKRLYVITGNDTVVTIDTTTSAVVGTPIRVGNDAHAAVVSLDGRAVYVSNAGDDTVSVINTATGKVTNVITVGAAPLGMTLSADGRFVYVANADSNSVSMIDTRLGKVVKSAAVGEAPTAVAVSADGSRLYVANSGSITASADGTISVLDAKTLQPVSALIPVGDYPTGLALSADGSQLYVANALSDQISVIDTTAFAVADVAVASAPTSIAAITGADGRPQVLIGHADMTGNATTAVSIVSFTGGQPLTLTPPAGTVPADDAADNELGALPPAPLEPNDWTKGFDITNLTGHEVVLTSETITGRASGPWEGTVLAPGATQHFDLGRNIIWTKNVADLSYFQKETDRTYRVRLAYVTLLFGTSANSNCVGGPCTSGGTQVVLLDQPGTTTTIFAQSAEDQVKAINALCTAGSAKCSWKTTSVEQTFSAPHPVGVRVTNRTGSNVTKSVAAADTVTTTTNLKISAKAGFDVLTVVKAELAGEYGKTWTDTHTFTDTVAMTVRPGYAGYIVARSPITRIHGDMTITVGNTTIIVKDMYVDTPTVGGEASFEVYETKLPDSTVV